MIIININNDDYRQSEKQTVRKAPAIRQVRYDNFEALDSLGRDQHQRLLNEANQSRLLKALRKGESNGSLPRQFEKKPAETLPLVERYLQRARTLLLFPDA